MSLIGLVVTLIVIGVLLYLFNTYITMIDGNIKQIINAVVIIAIVLWLLFIFIGPIPDIRIPTLRGG